MQYVKVNMQQIIVTEQNAPIEIWALDLKASTADSVDRISSTSVNSAPICNPHPIPVTARAEGGDHVPSGSLARTMPVL
jgi:hypothetical protein